MAGISDIRHELCLALALWNGSDPILKERMFGLTGPQGNHGEDVKEYWWYLEGLPSHALLRWRYHYPQAAFPYERLVDHGRGLRRPRARAARHRRVRRRPLLVGRRHLRQGLAHRGPDADRGREPRAGRGDPRRAADAVVPEHVVVGAGARRPRIEGDGAALAVADHALAGYRLDAAPGPDGALPTALFCENETNVPRVFGGEPTTPYPKDGINDHVVAGAETVNPNGSRNEGRAALPRHRRRRRQGRAAPAAAPAAGGHRPRAGRPRRSTTCSPHARPTPTRSTTRSPRRGRTTSTMRILRQACAGLIWSKQMYPFNVRRWLDGDPGLPPPPAARRHGRNAGWRHLDTFDVLAMPDPWEYPWFAAWDLGFHCVPWAHLDPAFAKYQLLVLLREWFQHPNGALPAYEWNFDDVNPPVHVMAALRVFVIDGAPRPRVPRAGLPEAPRQLHVVGQPRRMPTGTTPSAAASSGSTTSAPSTARTCRPARRWSRPTARPGWRTTPSRCW